MIIADLSVYCELVNQAHLAVLISSYSDCFTQSQFFSMQRLMNKIVFERSVDNVDQFFKL